MASGLAAGLGQGGGADPFGGYGGLCPALKPGVATYRHSYRGRPWYVFHDQAANRHVRVSAEGAEIIGALDGRRSVAEICDGLVRRGRAMEPERVGAFLRQLAGLELLNTGGVPSPEAMRKRHEEMASRKRAAQWLNPLFLKFPLFDPTRLLDAAMPWLAWMFGPLGIALWLAVVGSAAVAGLMHWGEFSANLSDRLLTAENLVLVGLVYPLIKACHEMGHGLALRRYGAEVRQVGIMLAAFFPVPYVDATSSLVMESKWRRIMISSAGILVELFLGSLAILLWCFAESSLARAVCFNVVVISGFSTLLFNGNPLQRFDGYYVMADLVEIPGLATRSTNFLAWLLRRYVAGDADAPRPEASTGEAWWFVLYGPASFIYRFWLVAFIAFTVAEKYLTAGLALGAWAMVGYIWPLLRGGWRMARAPAPGQRSWAALRLGGALVVLMALLFLVPVPRTVMTQGAFAMPEDATLRALVGGRVMELLLPQGAQVLPGTPVLRLEEPELAARIQRLEARLQERQAAYAQQLSLTRGRSALRQEEMAQAERELADARRDQERLVLRATGAGMLNFHAPTDLPGRYLQRGEAVATLWDPARAELRAMVPMAEIGAVRDRLRAVTVRPAFAPMNELPAEVLRIVPAATDQLPDSTLAIDGGGPFALAADGNGQRRLQEAMYQVDLKMQQPLPLPYLHGRAHVRFSVTWEPAGQQVWRRMRLLFLRRLHVT